jgi:hypothetical protein
MDKLSDDQLAALAFAWRRRSLQGEPRAGAVANRMEKELQRRFGAPSTVAARLDAGRSARARPWWRVW